MNNNLEFHSFVRQNWKVVGETVISLFHYRWPYTQSTHIIIACPVIVHHQNFLPCSFTKPQRSLLWRRWTKVCKLPSGTQFPQHNTKSSGYIGLQHQLLKKKKDIDTEFYVWHGITENPSVEAALTSDEWESHIWNSISTLEQKENKKPEKNWGEINLSWLSFFIQYCSAAPGVSCYRKLASWSEGKETKLPWSLPYNLLPSWSIMEWVSLATAPSFFSSDLRVGAAAALKRSQL